MSKSAVFEVLKNAAPTISVGILTADFMNLAHDIALVEQTDVKILHFDIMDGCFCPSMTFGPPIIKAIKTSLLKDVHLMINDPLDKIADYAKAGADIITIHAESAGIHIHRIFQMLAMMENVNDSSRGIIRGLALNPGTPLETVVPLLDELDMITLLAINPGWGGQKFAQSINHKFQSLKKIVDDSGKDILLALDGGITRDNIIDIASMGADIVITGSAVLDGKAPVENAKYMLDAVRAR